MIKVASDCSGIGAPEQALHNLGIEHEIVFACDKDKYARQTYLANFTPNQMFDDITTRDNSSPNIFSELYVAGFPCQAFSISGKRLGFEDIRGTIFFNCADYIRKQQPKYFILENVKGLISHDRPKGSKAKHGRTFQTIINLLGQTVNGQQHFPFYEDTLNYNIHYKVLNTKHYGVPQNRERIFVIGIRADLPNEFNFPKPIKLEKCVLDLLEENVDEKYFLSEKAKEGLIRANEREHKPSWIDLEGTSPTIDTRVGALTHRSPYIVHSLMLRSGDPNKGGTGHLSKNDVPSFCVDTGNSQAIELIKTHQLDGREQSGRVNSSAGLSPTITAIQGGGQIPLISHKSDIRKFTPLECFRLQGFPDSYNKVVSDTQLYKQAGNSMTVDVIEGIIKNLLK